MHINIALVSTLIASVIAVVTILLNEHFKRRDRALTERHKQIDLESAEHSRQLELYKTVYPDRFNAARQLMEKAVESFLHVHEYRATLTDSNIVQTEVKKVFLLAHSLEWILGPRITRAAHAYEQSAFTAIFSIRKGNIISNIQLDQDEEIKAMEACYSDLTRCVRQHIHVENFDNLFPE